MIEKLEGRSEPDSIQVTFSVTDFVGKLNEVIDEVNALRKEWDKFKDPASYKPKKDLEPNGSIDKVLKILEAEDKRL